VNMKQKIRVYNAAGDKTVETEENVNAIIEEEKNNCYILQQTIAASNGSEDDFSALIIMVFENNEAS